MEFITGGAFSGKRSAAKRKYSLCEGEYADFSQTKAEPEDMTTLRGVFSWHERIRRILLSEGDPEAQTLKMLDAAPDVITMDEVGMGIVPTDAFERKWREACGRCGCIIAARADSVTRMIMGLEEKLK